MQRKALQRSGSKFPVRYEEHIGALLPHLAYLMRMGKSFMVRMLWHLEKGETDKAFHDVMLIRKLADTIDDEPILIS